MQKQTQPAAVMQPRPRSRGFSLIELMVTVVVIGIIAAVAFPSYLGSVRKSRRAEAFAALAAIQQAQERHRSNNASYGNLSNPPDAATLPNILATTPNGYYAMSISSVSQTGYIAQAAAQGRQTSDGNCQLLAVRMATGSISYGSGTSSIDWTDPGRCWAK